MKTLSSLFFLIGIAVVTIIVAHLGLRPIADAFDHLGALGFFNIVLAQLGVNLFLGVAWFASCPQLGVARAIGARAVRDAVGNCLPFSQLGGMIIGVRATCKKRLSYSRKQNINLPEAVATNIMDITTEVLGQIAFILLAIICLARYSGANPYTVPAFIGMGIIGAGVGGFIWTQQKGGTLLKKLSALLSAHLAQGWTSLIHDNLHIFQAHLDSLWARPNRVAIGAFLHLVTWVAGAGVTWLALFLLGAPIPFFAAVAIEGIVCGIMSASFVVPGALGVQEAAYIALGLLVGVSADNGVVLSLLRRGRDLTIGIPVIIIWQFYEWRGMRALKAEAALSKTAPKSSGNYSA